MSLDIVIMQRCSTFSKTFHVGGYIQENVFNERMYPSCTCKAFQFGKRTERFGGRMYPKFCKHLNEILDNGCQWNEQWSSEKQTEVEICPKCGEPTESVRVTI